MLHVEDTLDPARHPVPEKYRKFVATSGSVEHTKVTRTQETSRQYHRIHSPKAGPEILICRGPIVANAVMIAEGDPSVRAVCGNPVRIATSLGPRKPHFIFDLEVAYADGARVLCHVLPEVRLEVEEDGGRRVPPHWIAIRAWSSEHGRNCAFFTDVDAARHWRRIENWRILLGFVLAAGRARLDPNFLLDVQQRVATSGTSSLSDLEADFPPAKREYLLEAVATLLHRGALTADLDNVLFSATASLKAVDRDAT